MENITTIAQLAVEHDYYCSECNYYSREAQSKFGTFDDFLNEMGEADIDMNLCFRWDIKKEEEDSEDYYMEIFIMHQRKGRYWYNHIEVVKDSDVPNIIKYLTPHLEKLKQLWTPLSL